jgi:hypothetical protein
MRLRVYAPFLSRRQLILVSLATLVDPRVLCAQPGTTTARWVEGQNLTLEVRYAGERYARLPER